MLLSSFSTGVCGPGNSEASSVGPHVAVGPIQSIHSCERVKENQIDVFEKKKNCTLYHLLNK